MTTSAENKKVLDAYSYVGSFAMAAARGGASEVVAVDESGVFRDRFLPGALGFLSSVTCLSGTEIARARAAR